MARISNMTIDGRVLSRLVIDGKEVSFAREPVTPDCLCFTAQEPNSTVKMVAYGSAPVVNLKISRDGRSWTPYVMGSDILLQNVDDKVYWKAVGSNERMATSGSSYNYFEMTGKIGASGNINSLLEEDEDAARTLSLAGKDYCYFYLFLNIWNLTTAPELPSTTLANNCYNGMFANCSSLKEAPVLSAETLVGECYKDMFRGCTSLTSAPVLPATTLADRCYTYMFRDCTSLTQAPVLPATTLNYYCYAYMFSGCSSLVNAPELPATTLAENCYNSMFSNCTSLVNAPELPATKLDFSCYTYMFSGCTSLTSAPVLPATTLYYDCYNYMFQNCTNLNYVKVAFTNWNMIDCTNNWLPDNVGKFECKKELINNTTDRTTSTVPPNWIMKAYDAPPDSLCFTAEEPNSTVKLQANGNAPVVNLQTSTDGQSWTPYTIGDTITLANANDKVYFKAIGSNDRMGSRFSDYNYFSMTGKIAASGNTNSLLEEDEQTVRTMSLAGKSYCYYRLFYNCISLTSAPELPATTLANNCYQNMFQNCRSLVNAPVLPVTTLANSCY